MSLIACPECGKEISTDAVRCPNCGAKTSVSALRERWLAAVGLLAIVAVLILLMMWWQSTVP